MSEELKAIEARDAEWEISVGDWWARRANYHTNDMHLISAFKDRRTLLRLLRETQIRAEGAEAREASYHHADRGEYFAAVRERIASLEAALAARDKPCVWDITGSGRTACGEDIWLAWCHVIDKTWLPKMRCCPHCGHPAAEAK